MKRLLWVWFALAWTVPVVAAALATAPVTRGGDGSGYAAEGVVEAVRQTELAAQVPGRITDLRVKEGDRVSAGQVLARIDARAAAEQAAASRAQVEAARAQLEAAKKDFERSKQLFDKRYISQAAFDRAEAQYRAAEAQARALSAQAGAAQVGTTFYTLKAPYAGVVASVGVSLGDMAMPGQPFITLYDPRALRVAVDIPQSYAPRLATSAPARIELPALGGARRWQQSNSVTVLPLADTGSHTIRVRIDLPDPHTAKGLIPGLSARAWLPLTGGAATRLTVPATAVIHRTELNAVYVVDARGVPQLRQVRLGETQGERVQVLSGLREGERVALDPLAAARVR